MQSKKKKITEYMAAKHTLIHYICSWCVLFICLDPVSQCNRPLG